MQNPEIFAINRNEIQDRFDPHFHRPYFKDLMQSVAKRPFRKLGDIISQSSEVWDKTSPLHPISFPYIEISALGLGTNEYNVEIVNTKDAPSRARQIVRTDDIIVSLTRPHRGAIATIKSEHNLSIASTGFAILRDIKIPTITRDYLLNVLSSRICLDQFLQRSSGGNYPAITPDQLDKLLIPFPNTKIQHILSSKLELARNQRFSNLAQTDELLKGIDEFVLETIGVHVTDGPKKRIFAIPLKAARDRFDADFNSPRFKTIRIALESGPCPSKQLKELCIRMQSGFAAGKQDQAFDFEQGVPHLRPLNFNIYGEISLEGTKFVPKQAIQDSDLCKRGEVLFNNTNSTELVGKSAVFELTQDCACSNHVTRLEVEASMNPHYLAAVLNALRRLGYLGMLSTNFNNQAGINIETLGNLKVPCPTIEKQDTIAQEINHRRDEARRLSNLVEKEWNAAKEWFEVQLLKEAE